MTRRRSAADRCPARRSSRSASRSRARPAALAARLRGGDPAVIGGSRRARRARPAHDRSGRRCGTGAARIVRAIGGGDDPDDRRHRDRRPHRPRQDDAAAGADRHRRRPAARGAAARDDHRRRLRAPHVCPTAPSSTSSTSRATTGWSATCSSAPARSTRRCSSWPPTTGRAPRRIEHLALLDALGIRHGLAVVTKADVAGPARTRRGRRPSSRGCSRARRWPARRSSPSRRWTVAGSRRCGPRSPTCAMRRPGSRRSVGAGCIARRRAGRPPRDRPRLRGQGPRRRRDRHAAWSRRSARGATLRLVPGDRTVRIREIQVHGVAVDRAEPGRTALNLAGVEAGDLHRGIGPDRRSSGRRERPDPRRAAPGPARPGAGPPASGTAAVDARVGRSGRDAHRPARRDLRRRSSASPRRSRSRRAIGSSSGERPARNGSSAASCSTSRRPAGSRAAGSRPSASARLATAVGDGRSRRAIAAARLDLTVRSSP